MSELQGNVEVGLTGPFTLLGYYSLGSDPDFMLCKVVSRNWAGTTLWRKAVSDVTHVGVYNGTIVGKCPDGLFIFDTAEARPKATFYTSEADWQAALNQAGIAASTAMLQTPKALASTRSVTELKPSEYRIAPQLGITDANLAWIILFAGLVVPLVLSRVRSVSRASPWISLLWGIILAFVCAYVSPSISAILFFGTPLLYLYLGRPRGHVPVGAVTPPA